MATTPTSKSALTSGAAKDDTVGNDGHFTFTIKDLLANDPGGAAKVDVGSQFFFGTTAEDRLHQDTYLEPHGLANVAAIEVLVEVLAGAASLRTHG